MNTLLKLYDYQTDVLNALRAGFARGHRAQMLAAATGFGKTEIAIAMMQGASLKGKRSAMVLDRLPLVNQTSARLDKYGIEHGVLQANHPRMKLYERIQICSSQTLEKRNQFPDIDLLIIDEAHDLRKKVAEFIKTNKHIKVVGLSATPFRKGLGEIYTNIVSSISTSELVKQKRLVPLRVYVGTEIDMTGAKKARGDWTDNEKETRSIQITGDVVKEWVAKTHEVFGGPRKTIVFASGVKHGEDLAQKFAEAGYNFICVSYKSEKRFTGDVLRDFARPDTKIHGLIATDLLTKGFDVPDVMIGVSARPFSRSLSYHIQQMGRVMRTAPNKEFALWLCHSGNYLGFQDQWENVFENGVRRLNKNGHEQPRREFTAKQKEKAKCPQCKTVWQGHTHMCIHCGYVKPSRTEVVTRSGHLVSIDGKGAQKAQELRQSFYSQLLAVANMRGYKEGWAAWQYKNKFKEFPNGLKKEPTELSPGVINWVKSRDIAYAKKRAAL